MTQIADSENVTRSKVMEISELEYSILCKVWRECRDLIKDLLSQPWVRIDN